MLYRNRKIATTIRRISVFALIPMLLWPSFARSGCCCTLLDCQAKRLVSENDFLVPTPDWENLGVLDQAQESRTEEQQEEKFACPRCRAAAEASGAADSTDGTASIFALCECVHTDFVSLPLTQHELVNHESSVQSYFLDHCVVDQKPALSMSDMSARRNAFFDSAMQRCALFCCWLN